jgi:hypothetical protein
LIGARCTALCCVARLPAPGARGTPVERRLGRSTLDDKIGDRVGVLLVRIAFLSDAAEQLHARALLDHVSRLVRRGVEVGRAGKRHRIAGRIGLRPHLARRARRGPADERADAPDVVPAERTLDRVEVWQRAVAPAQAALGHLVDVRRGRRQAWRTIGRAVQLHGALEYLHQRRLARRPRIDRRARSAHSQCTARSVAVVAHTSPTWKEDSSKRLVAPSRALDTSRHAR